MNPKDWQKIREDFKAQGKIPTPKTAENQIKTTKKRLFNNQSYKSFVSDLDSTPLTKEQKRLVKRQLFAGTRWHRRGPRWCACCLRLFLPKQREQIYHANCCGAFGSPWRWKISAVLNQIEFLPSKTIRDIGGTILLPRCYVVLFLLGLCELRFRFRIFKWEGLRLWWKLSRQEEPYWHYRTDPRCRS